mmetsp:Transcript_70053/g.194671  ORF Transcript_70053/g.194671 Transcript_70053/m.194671 type:complete len:241 (+) Transcript_70053:43-765(+)
MGIYAEVSAPQNSRRQGPLWSFMRFSVGKPWMCVSSCRGRPSHRSVKLWHRTLGLVITLNRRSVLKDRPPSVPIASPPPSPNALPRVLCSPPTMPAPTCAVPDCGSRAFPLRAALTIRLPPGCSLGTLPLRGVRLAGVATQAASSACCSHHWSKSRPSCLVSRCSEVTPPWAGAATTDAICAVVFAAKSSRSPATSPPVTYLAVGRLLAAPAPPPVTAASLAGAGAAAAGSDLPTRWLAA